MIIGSERDEAAWQGFSRGQRKRGWKEVGLQVLKVFILSLTEQAMYARTDEKSFDKSKGKEEKGDA